MFTPPSLHRTLDIALLAEKKQGSTTNPSLPRLSLHIIDNYCITQGGVSRRATKKETPENKRISLQTGEWKTSTDFKDAYFHISINLQSRKYHVQGQSCHFKALPFGLSIVPMEFTMIVMEVKLITQNKGIRIYQYLDDSLVRTTSHQTYLQHTHRP